MTHYVVFFQAAIVEVAFCAAVEDTLVVTTTLIFLVNLQMLFEVRSRGKLFVAVLALERFLSRVDSLVTNQVTHLTEGLIASIKVTLVWLLLIVNSSMLLQRRILSERLVTLVAIEKKFKNLDNF